MKKYFVIIFTLFSVGLIFLLRMFSYNGSSFMIYTLTVTSFLAIIYIISYMYRPVQDKGYRPSVSIVIPAKNEEDAIQRTIKSCLDSDYPSEKLEVIVIDDGSTDNTYEKMIQMQGPRVHVIRHEVNKGKRQAMASGIRIAIGDIFVSIDSDSQIKSDAIALLVQPFTDKCVTAVCGHGNVGNKNMNLLTKLQHAWYQEMFYILKSMESKLGAVQCCSGILAAYRRENVLDVLDEWLGQNFFGTPIIISDDRQLTNLSLRGTKTVETKCAKVVYQSNAICYTAAPENVRQFLKQQIRWKRGSFHGTIAGSKFMWKKGFLASAYFYPYMYLTYLTPFIIGRWLLYLPIVRGEYVGAIAFLSGVLYVGIMHGLNVWMRNDESEAIFYRMLFGFVSLFLTLIILPYSILTIRNGGWMTRKQGSTL